MKKKEAKVDIKKETEKKEMTRTEKNIYRKEDVKSKQNKTTESSTETAMGKAENLGIRRIFVCRLTETSTSVMRVSLVARNGKKKERER